MKWYPASSASLSKLALSMLVGQYPPSKEDEVGTFRTLQKWPSIGRKIQQESQKPGQRKCMIIVSKFHHIAMHDFYFALQKHSNHKAESCNLIWLGGREIATSYSYIEFGKTSFKFL